ncbi:MAG: hypothetical protein AB3N63_09165 [Puniceicoccaceae bacterium]
MMARAAERILLHAGVIVCMYRCMNARPLTSLDPWQKPCMLGKWPMNP